MWQVLLAAAVAGTGIAAKRLLNPNADPNPQAKCSSQSELSPEDLSASVPPEPQLSLPPDVVKLSGHGDEVTSEVTADQSSIFRFSSSDSIRSKNRFRSNSKKSKGDNAGTRRWESEESEKKCIYPAYAKEGRRLIIRLKKRRTSNKKASGRFESCSSNDAASSFSQGLGFGIMYMMSAGKAEIRRLNMAMDETVKVVDELKTELLHKRKSSFEDTHHPILKSKTECMIPTCLQPDGEEQEVVEMDQLEAELESELQKLPGCIRDVSGPPESSTSDDWFWGKQDDPRQVFNGVSALELEKKLSNLLIEQQSTQIVELEDELHNAQSKLIEKEAELRALKSCVKRLTDFSLSNASDEQSDDTVGMKQAMDIVAAESYN